MAIDFQALAEQARAASENAYCKYSNFVVGAALLAADGRVFTGVNVENVSYGLTICAERAAVFRAVTEGATDFAAIAIYTPTDKPTLPCGACRQVLVEFARDLPIYSMCNDGAAEYDLADLLPHSFRFDD